MIGAESIALIHQNLLKCLVAPNPLQDSKQGFQPLPNANLCLFKWNPLLQGLTLSLGFLANLGQNKALGTLALNQAKQGKLGKMLLGVQTKTCFFILSSIPLEFIHFQGSHTTNRPISQIQAQKSQQVYFQFPKVNSQTPQTMWKKKHLFGYPFPEY